MIHKLHISPALRFALTFATCTLLLSGCKSGKKVQTQAYDAAGSAQILPQNEGSQFDVICARYGAWSDLSASMKVDITSPTNLSVSSKIEMKRDQWIFVSVRMLGMEVASVWVDNDSIHALDKYHKLCCSESVGNLLGATGITLGNLQDLLLGRAFIVGSDGGTLSPSMASRLSLSDIEQGLVIMPRQQPQRFEYGFLAQPQQSVISVASVTTASGKAAVVKYDNFVEVKRTGAVAALCDITLATSKRYNANLTLSDIKTDSGLKRTWKQPSGYKSLTASQLLQKLAKF